MTEETQIITADDVGTLDTRDPNDLESLYQQALDDAKATELEKELLNPTDNYLSTPPLVVSVQVFEAKDDLPERVVFRAYGPYTGKKTGKEIRFGFSFSPQARRYVNDDGTEALDSASKNYVRLRSAYKKHFKQAPATIADLKTYVEQFQIGVRGAQYDGRNGPAWGIFNIFAVTA